MCRFSTSIFSRLGLDFGGLWASKMEPSWLFWPQKPVRVALLQRLKLNVIEKLRLGGLQARFWRPQGSILEGLGIFFSRFSHRERCLRLCVGDTYFGIDLCCVTGSFEIEKWPRVCRATRRPPRMPVLPCLGSDGRESMGIESFLFLMPLKLAEVATKPLQKKIILSCLTMRF